MLRDQVLALLKAGDAPCSGEGMSRTLGVSRAAVWKAVEALRQEGYVISSAPHRGYRLEDSPDLLSPGELAGALAGRTVGAALLCLDTVDSTNNELKRRADTAPDGLAVLAQEQTGGRGRLGRSFVSPAGKGLYLSVLLRPQCVLADAGMLTAWTAVAVCRALERCCGVRAGIKWPNDIVLEGRKLCGILTELELEAETAALRHVIVGVGINVSQDAADFGPEVAPVAISLAQALGRAPRRSQLAAEVLSALDDLYRAFPAQKADYLARYRALCVTAGRAVRVLRPGQVRTGTAEAVNEDFALLVRWDNGEQEALSSGEVSVRGLLGYG
ncbi:biotin--[acetyl-CoA-carboxylase] ligase [Lawsonibacter hominis]|uniref:biotin--[acetyl-CoA-carboxylase] ligase n=1 Tax=Lawsonibacter hominis TaxID=2763053 RepID=UPI00332AE628